MIWWVPTITWTIIILSLIFEKFRFRVLYILLVIKNIIFKLIKWILLKLLDALIASKVFGIIIVVTVLVIIDFVGGTAVAKNVEEAQSFWKTYFSFEGGEMVSDFLSFVIEKITSGLQRLLMFFIVGSWELIKLIFLGIPL